MADGHIVAVSDRMISNADYVPAADDGALKARKLSKTWAVMVAAENVSLFLPVVDNVKNRLGIFDDAYDLMAVESAVTEAYRTLFNAEFAASYLARYGMRSISEFRTLGRAQFGDDKFNTICNAIDEYSLGIELLVYGFDAYKIPHIFQVSNPGSVTNHDLFGYGVIGSGFYMATSSMRKKRLPYDLNNVVYRLLEAKFSAETASGVGKNTALLTMNAAGKDASIGYGSIDKIKEIWRSRLEQADPQEALDIISTLVGTRDLG